MGAPWKYFTDEERKAGIAAKYKRWEMKLSPEKREAQRNREKNNKRMSYTELRIAILEKFGSTCALCGYNTDTRALQLDHVNGGGRKERRKLGWYTVYNKVLNDTNNEYQLLCANCNQIKRYDNDEVHIVNDSLRSSNSCNTSPALG